MKEDPMFTKREIVGIVALFLILVTFSVSIGVYYG